MVHVRKLFSRLLAAHAAAHRLGLEKSEDVSTREQEMYQAGRILRETEPDDDRKALMHCTAPIELEKLFRNPRPRWPHTVEDLEPATHPSTTTSKLPSQSSPQPPICPAEPERSNASLDSQRGTFRNEKDDPEELLDTCPVNFSLIENSAWSLGGSIWDQAQLSVIPLELTSQGKITSEKREWIEAREQPGGIDFGAIMASIITALKAILNGFYRQIEDITKSLYQNLEAILNWAFFFLCFFIHLP